MKRRMGTSCAAAMLALALGGCAAQGTADSSSEPVQSAKQSAMVSPAATSSPTNTPAPTREPMPVRVEGRLLSQDARTQQGKTMLPLLETMELLGYRARVSELGEDEGTRRIHTFTKDKEEISVSYLLTDNTVSDISFVRDKLIVPVDRLLLFEDETVFAPANFFEEAAGVYVSAESGQVSVSTAQPDISSEG